MDLYPDLCGENGRFVLVPDGSGTGSTYVYNEWCPCYQHHGERNDWEKLMIESGKQADCLAVAQDVPSCAGQETPDAPETEPPIVTATPTATPTAQPTAAPTPNLTAAPTPQPTPEPTREPTREPTSTPTSEPTPSPIVENPVAVSPGILLIFVAKHTCR
jgi:hypothetical protein